MRTVAIPSGVTRLVSTPSSRKERGDVLVPCGDYPSNARCFVHLDARLLPYWHALFDVCPSLLTLDPPEGLNLFRSFMTWAYRNRPPLNWTYYLSICRWLLTSSYRKQIHEEHIDAFMTAAAARWIDTDETQSVGLVLAWEGSPVRVYDWKVKPRLSGGIDSQYDALAPLPWDFAWRPLSGGEGGGFNHWLPIPRDGVQPQLSSVVRDQ